MAYAYVLKPFLFSIHFHSTLDMEKAVLIVGIVVCLAFWYFVMNTGK